MKKNQNSFRLPFSIGGALAISAFILLGGAAYAPLLLKPQAMPVPLFEKPAIAVSHVLQRSVVRKHRPKSLLAQRLNNRYQIGRNLRASA